MSGPMKWYTMPMWSKRVHRVFEGHDRDYPDWVWVVIRRNWIFFDKWYGL